MYITDIKKAHPYKKRLLHFDYLNPTAITAEIDKVTSLLGVTVLDQEKDQYNNELRLLNKLYKKQPIRAQAIIKKDHQILFLKCFGKRHQDIFYTLPGGALGECESGHVALHREIDEELGTQVLILNQYPSVYDYSDHDFYLRYETYLCELDDLLPENHSALEENTKILELIWIDIDHLIETSLDESMYFHTVPSIPGIYKLLQQ